MDVFERLNRKFGAWYEGLFGGGDDRGDLRPRDMLRRILAAMEDNRREGLDGQVYVPNAYTLQITPRDDDERQYLQTFLDADELAAAVARAIEQHGYRVKGTLLFTVEEKEAAALGSERFRILCRFDTSAALPAATPMPAAPAAPPRPVEMPYTSPAAEDEDELGTVPALPAATLASLIVRGADGRLQDVYPLTARGARIGRGRQVGNDIVIAGDAMISKSHARITYESDRFVLYDENSTNGTYVAGERLRPGVGYPLQPDDAVRLGGTTFLFRPATVAPRPVAAPPSPAAAPLSGPPPVFRLTTADGETFTLASEMTVGRSLTSDITLIAGGVSSLHARLSVRGDSVYVEDLQTPGGTFVNGERIPAAFPVALYEGDQVGFGETALRLSRANGTVSPLGAS